MVNPAQPPAQRRSRAVHRLRRALQSKAWPRMLMAGLVLATGASGLLASFLLLQAGMDSMALRYPLAVLVAYGVFLLMLWLWLRFRDPLMDLTLDLVPTQPSTPRPPAWTSGKGGDFSGAGASGHFDAPVPTPAATGWLNAHTPAGPIGQSSNKLAEADALPDELFMPLGAVALAAGLVFSSFYIVYSAPTLMAELLLDGALSATLYRRLRQVAHPNWITTALRHTLPAFLLTALVLAGAGWGLQTQAVDARTLGEALQQMRALP